MNALGKISGKLLRYFFLDRTHDASMLWLIKDRAGRNRIFLGNGGVHVDFLWQETDRTLPRATITAQKTR
jgi:hypothetical protein